MVLFQSKFSFENSQGAGVTSFSLLQCKVSTELRKGVGRKSSDGHQPILKEKASWFDFVCVK